MEGKAMKAVALAIFLLWMGIAVVGAQEKVIIGGSGSMTDGMAELAKVYLAKHPSESVHVVMDGMSNTGGMEGTKMGRLNIGLVTDEPKGADKDKLMYKVVGRLPVGVALHKSSPISKLSTGEICDVFSGKITSWNEVGGGNAKILVLTRRRDDANTRPFREKMACFKSLQITPDAIALDRGGEVLDAVNMRPNTIALVSVDPADSIDRPNLKTVAIDGISPTLETVQTGKYKFYNEKGIVTLGAPQGAVKRFLEYLGSAEAHKILANHGMIPVK
jgi:phosphate transport system substrate-binding protein